MAIEFVTDKNHNPIRNINTVDVKLTEDEAYSKAEQGVLSAFKDTSNPCDKDISRSLELVSLVP